MATTTEGNRSPDVSYAGSALASSTTYYWRILFIDDSEAAGPYSTTTASFSLAAGSGGGGSSNNLQDISYTYDNVGNITTITDFSDTAAAKTITFGYDDLYRLTSASTTAASSTPFSRTYTYSKIGNITNKSDQGDYTYGETGYANPHAVTDIAGTTYSYDNNGNVTDAGSWDYTWDYRNRLTQSANGTATTTHEYNHNNLRIKRTVDGTAIIYPNKYFNVKGATTTAHIFLPDGSLIATIEGDGATSTATTTAYIHTDHMGGTNVVTNASSTVIETTDYYPFGEQRIATGSFDEQRKFIGEHYDDETELSYLNARYYDGGRGQFLSQDPVFLGDPRAQNLQNPQSLNSYSYAENNPIVKKDPTGHQAVETATAAYIIWTVLNTAYNAIQATIERGLIENLEMHGASQREINEVKQRLENRQNSFIVGGLVGIRNPAVGVGLDAYGIGNDIDYNIRSSSGGYASLFSSFANLGGSFQNETTPATLNFNGSFSQGGSSGGGNIRQHSQAVIQYASTPGADLTDSDFAASIRAINEYNSSGGESREE